MTHAERPKARSLRPLVGLVVARARWLTFGAVLFSNAALADAARPPVRVVVAPLFSINKSQNHNQVQYAIYLDERCAPASAAPVFAYWRMFEQGPARTAPLLPRELQAYGLASQSVVARREGRSVVTITLRAVPSRLIVVETAPGPRGACLAYATIQIAGQPAHLFNVYARLKWSLEVDYLLLQGWSMDGKQIIKERLNR